MFEKVVEIGLLFDYYGKLLTERQQQIIKLYYYQDLSLGEIAETLEVSRQAVYDHLQRGEKILHEYENKLGLVTRFRNIKSGLDNLKNYIDKNGTDIDKKEEIIKKITKITQHL